MVNDSYSLVLLTPLSSSQYCVTLDDLMKASLHSGMIGIMMHFMYETLKKTFSGLT